MGADLYARLKDWLKEHLDALLKDADSHMDESLLVFYSKQWTRYTTGATYINHIFRYLNRHWVKREIDEGHKNIYDIYTVFYYFWTFFFELPTYNVLMDA
jgi:cullin 1